MDDRKLESQPESSQDTSKPTPRAKGKADPFQVMDRCAQIAKKRSPRGSYGSTWADNPILAAIVPFVGILIFIVVDVVLYYTTGRILIPIPR